MSLISSLLTATTDHHLTRSKQQNRLNEKYVYNINSVMNLQQERRETHVQCGQSIVLGNKILKVKQTNSNLQLSVMKLDELETNGVLPSTEICHMFLKPTAAGGWRERDETIDNKITM